MIPSLFDNHFHPSEGLSRCGNLIDFVCEALERPDDEDLRLSATALDGLREILNIASSTINEVMTIISDADMKCFGLPPGDTARKDHQPTR